VADPLVTSPIPGAGGYEQADVQATNAFNNALARINQQRLSTLRQYGYGGSVDPTSGTITGIHVDATNPYGSFQQMLGGAAHQSMQDVGMNQERGLVGGLANQALTADKSAFGGASAQLGSALSDALSGLQDQQDTASYTRDSALYNAEQAAAQSAISGGNFDTPSYDGITVPNYGDTGVAPPVLKPPKAPAKGPKVNPRAQKILRQRIAAAQNKRRPK
jgi:hypothetical protein